MEATHTITGLGELASYRDAAAPKLDEPVLAACLFSRQGMMTTKAAGHLGLIARLLAQANNKRRAAGLPQHFVLAVTPTRVHAFDTKVKSWVGNRTPEVGDEVAVWDRAAIHVSSKSGGPLMTDVTIESPGEDERVHCRVGKHACSDAFVRLLSDPRATA